MKVGLLMVAAILATGMTCVAAASPANAEAGRLFLVVDEVGKPIPGVSIQVEGRYMTGHLQPTDEQGRRDYDREVMLKPTDPRGIRLGKEGYRTQMAPFPTEWPATFVMVRAYGQAEIHAREIPPAATGVQITEVIYAIKAPISTTTLHFRDDGTIVCRDSSVRGTGVPSDDPLPSSAQRTPEQFETLANVIKRADFWNLAPRIALIDRQLDEAGMRKEDLSSYSITVRSDHPDSGKSVYHVAYEGKQDMPNELLVIVNHLEMLWGRPILHIGF